VIAESKPDYFAGRPTKKKVKEFRERGTKKSLRGSRTRTRHTLGAYVLCEKKDLKDGKTGVGSWLLHEWSLKRHRKSKCDGFGNSQALLALQQNRIAGRRPETELSFETGGGRRKKVLSESSLNHAHDTDLKGECYEGGTQRRGTAAQKFWEGQVDLI